MEEKTEENEVEKAREKTRMDTMAEMLLQTNRKLNCLRNVDNSKTYNLRQNDEDRAPMIDLPNLDGGH